MTIYLNDVKLDGGELRGQLLSGVDVRFDENGDVRIIAKGYKITSDTPPPTTRSVGAQVTAAALAKRYFIATTPQQRTGAAQWDVDVFVNNTFIRKFRSKDPDPFVEISKYMKPGVNAIHFSAKKESGERGSTSPTDTFELVIGSGDLSQGQLMLEPLAKYKRTAAEVGGYNTDITIEL